MDKLTENDVQQFRQSVSGNFDYLNNSSFMLARINTNPLLDKIRKDFSGRETFVMQDANGNFYEEEKQIGKPLANAEGIMHIINMIEEIVNPHTVQGNLKGEHYWNFIANCREEVTNAIVMNAYDWHIEDQYLNYIIDKTLRIIELFLTRPIENKERESYQKEFQSKEVIQSQPEKKSFFGIGKS